MFLDASTLPAGRSLQDHWKTVLAECLALPDADFTAWPERGLYNAGWDVYGLYQQGRPVLENSVFCPQTTRILGGIPGVVTAGFSRLAAGTHIAPHRGYTSRVLRLHLGLQCNDRCGIRVGNEQRSWEPGRCLLFDDTQEHEAWNAGDDARLVLLVDLARTAVEGRA